MTEEERTIGLITFFAILSICIGGYLIFTLVSCSEQEGGPWYLNPSKYINNEAENARYAESYFSSKYPGENRDWMKISSFNYQASLETMEKECKQKAFACIPWFFELLIWDSPDDYQRCTEIQHEFGHMGAYLYGDHSGDPNHTLYSDYFNKYVFDTCNQMVKSKEVELGPFYIQVR